jgi:hypothetical protein
MHARAESSANLRCSSQWRKSVIDARAQTSSLINPSPVGSRSTNPKKVAHVRTRAQYVQISPRIVIPHMRSLGLAPGV